MPEKNWTLLHSRTVGDHRIFTVREDRYRLAPAGDERDFVVLDSPDWVNVIPITSSGEVVMIRQFRHGIRRTTLEIPGGMINPGEAPAAAALRELAEETGFAAARCRELGHVSPNPAIQSNRCWFFLAEGAYRAGDADPDPGERIEVVLHPLAAIPALITMGEIDHALVLCAFGLAGLLSGPLSGGPR